MNEMFYLTTHSTHFIYGYMASDIWLRTILIVRKETRWRHMGYSFRLTARVLLYAPSHRQDSTYHGLCYTSRGALAGMRNSSMGPPPWRIDPMTHRTMSKRSYHGATSRSWYTYHAAAIIVFTNPHCWSTGFLFHDHTFQPVLQNWCNNSHGTYYPVCVMMHIKEPLLLLGKSSRCSGSRFPLSLSEWSFTICPVPYNRKKNVLIASLNIL